MTREKKGLLVFVLAAVLTFVGPLVSSFALAPHMGLLAGVAIVFNTLAIVVGLFGLVDAWSKILISKAAAPPEAEDPVPYPLTGHLAPPLLCDQCMAFTKDVVDRHVENHVLLVDDCAVCQHMREAPTEPADEPCVRCGRFAAEEVRHHLETHILLTDDCSVCEHIRDGL